MFRTATRGQRCIVVLAKCLAMPACDILKNINGVLHCKYSIKDKYRKSDSVIFTEQHCGSTTSTSVISLSMQPLSVKPLSLGLAVTVHIKLHIDIIGVKRD